MHRIFEPGRRVFVSKPINHFELEPSAKLSLLFGGGIGVTPMVAFAHELHRKGGDFRLMYSASQKSTAAFDGALTGWLGPIVSAGITPIKARALILPEPCRPMTPGRIFMYVDQILI